MGVRIVPRTGLELELIMTDWIAPMARTCWICAMVNARREGREFCLL